MTFSVPVNNHPRGGRYLLALLCGRFGTNKLWNICSYKEYRSSCDD